MVEARVLFLVRISAQLDFESLKPLPSIEFTQPRRTTMLTQEQAEQWKEDGYVVVPDFFNKSEVELMRDELYRLKDEGHGRNPVTRYDGETPDDDRINFQIIPLNTISELFRSLPLLPKVMDSLKLLLGPNIIRFLDQIFLKPGGGKGVGTNWHTDNAYFQSPIKTEGTGLWIALQDSNLDNGTMTVIPKSHLEDPEHERDFSSDHHITCAANIDPSKAIPVIVPAGGVVFFNFGIVHSTGDNNTNEDRAGAAFHFSTPNAIKGSSKWVEKVRADREEMNRLVLLRGEDGGTNIEPYVEEPSLEPWQSVLAVAN